MPVPGQGVERGSSERRFRLERSQSVASGPMPGALQSLRHIAPVGVVAASALLLPGGCREPTQITLRISTDIPCGEVGKTAVAVGRLGALEKKDAASTTSNCRDGYIGTLVIVPSGADDSEVGVRIVTGLGPTPEACVASGYQGGCVVARRALRFIPHVPVELPVEMSASCRDVACGPEETCLHGACISALIGDPTECAQPNQCQPVDAGAVDAGADVGADAPGSSDADAGGADAPGDVADTGPACTPPIAGGGCDTTAQCGCTALQTCSFSADTTVCVAAGAGKLNEQCDAAKPCSPGLDCFFPVTPPGACKKYCSGSSDCAGGTSQCVSVVDSKSKPVPGVGFCSSGCALESPASTCGSLGCHALGAETTDCLPTGTGTGPGSCTSSFDCAPGYGCDNGKDCRKWCRVGKADCGDAGTCVPGNVTVGSVAYGVCL